LPFVNDRKYPFCAVSVLLHVVLTTLNDENDENPAELQVIKSRPRNCIESRVISETW